MENKKIEFNDIGVLVTLDKPDHFLLLKETLTRMGVASKKSKTLYQSCHVLHKRGEYRIVHFLELFLLDSKTANLSDDDFKRRNTIAKLLDQWKLCTIVDKLDVELTVPISEIKIVPHKEKREWSLISKYTVGAKK